jgi:hypothetical protein
MKKVFVLVIHAFVGWALCGAVIGLGFQFTSEQNALIIHALGAPIIFGLLSWNYFRRFAFTSPLQTACIFLGITVCLDLFLVAMIIQKSYAMFGSILGTWIPFLLIFLSTFVVGRMIKKV